MGLCLADSLLSTQGEFCPLDALMRFSCWWMNGYNNTFHYDKLRGSRGSIGLGGNISSSLQAFRQNGKPYTHSGDCSISGLEYSPLFYFFCSTQLFLGNGSIMRLAPIAVACNHNPSRAMEMAAMQSRTTHQVIFLFCCCL